MIVVYNTKTGVITSWGNFDPALNTPAGHDYIETDTAPVNQMVNVKTRKLVADKAAITEAQWAEVRRIRDMRITATDYLIMPDYPISEDARAALATYRQALRDVTKQADPTAISWPDYPTI